jgi:hypothetical protein
VPGGSPPAAENPLHLLHIQTADAFNKTFFECIITTLAGWQQQTARLKRIPQELESSTLVQMQTKHNIGFGMATTSTSTSYMPLYKASTEKINKQTPAALMQLNTAFVGVVGNHGPASCTP